MRDARERYDIPVVEVVHPAVRRAVSATRSGRIGVIGTRATCDRVHYTDHDLITEKDGATRRYLHRDGTPYGETP